MIARYAEIPPTAGLPPLWQDLWPGKNDLTQQLQSLLGLQQPQIECSGTAALIVALTALRESLGKAGSQRSKVIIPAYTCPLVALAIAHCGLNVQLCDVQEGYFDFDHEHLAHLLDERTLAVIPTHLGGRVADVSSIQPLVADCGAALIEDAAQALGANVGKHADVTFYSLAVGKGLSLYEGGILVSTSEELREKLQLVSQQVIPSCKAMELRRCIEFVCYTAFYRPHGLYFAYGLPLRRALAKGNFIEAVGDNFGSNIPLHRVSHWRKSVGAQAIKRLPDFLTQTRQQALKRSERLKQIQGVTVLTDTNGQQGVWPFLMVLMPDARRCKMALDLLWRRTLGVTRLFIHALPDYVFLQNIVSATDVPNARDFASRMLTLSNSLWLHDDDFEDICQILEKVNN